MRIEAEQRKNDNMDFHHDVYTWIKFIPEPECYSHDLMMIGRMTSAMDRAKISYNLKLTSGVNESAEIAALEVHESYLLKLLTNVFWHNKKM